MIDFDSAPEILCRTGVQWPEEKDCPMIDNDTETGPNPEAKYPWQMELYELRRHS